MDEAPTKWNITFAKHLKQKKRKVYRDGFLSLHTSASKVMLYDDSDQLLECRILKNDEVVSSGETLTFNAYLVDVGEPEGGQKPLDNTYIHSREMKVPKIQEERNEQVWHIAGESELKGIKDDRLARLVYDTLNSKVQEIS